MDDKPRYWFGAKLYGWGYRPPLNWQGWVAYAVWLTVWLAATPFVRGGNILFRASPFFSGCLQCCLE